MADFVSPAYGKAAFYCSHCGTFAHQLWYIYIHGKQFNFENGAVSGTNEIPGQFSCSVCTRCNRASIWFEKDMIFPRSMIAPKPNKDLPENIAGIYREAAAVLQDSPRAAAALLRLAIQELCIHLNQPGKNLNSDIGALVAVGLPVGVQEALDAVRVIGNNAVHPGTLDLNDDRELANSLFMLVNLIVERMISIPKQLDGIYKSLPKGTLDAITERDNP